ncbi:MAG: methylmalonyl-CoA epimerase [Ignavibacteria bacterium]|nr:methylmalonyl-CoA epimerase [Ignavibacteria bacterium]
MINKISHLGIAVKDLKTASEMYRKLFQTEPSEMEHIEEQKVNVVKFTIGQSTIELLEGTSEDSPICRFIEKKGEGIHHIAYESDNINIELNRLENDGFELINNKPLTGSDNMLIAFVKPKSIGGVLTEICQH